MAKKNTTQEVNERIKELTGTKEKQLAEIRKKQGEARTKIEAAGLAIKEATERMDLEAYEKAREDRRKAQAALDMYSGRYDQISKREYISEKDSDSVINSLLEYEDMLATDFKKAIVEPLKKLAELHKEYTEGIRETEGTIRKWETTIHPNYSTRGATKYKDPATGQYTDRSSTPVPVHRLPFTGCNEAAQLGLYLEKAAPLMKD